MRSSLCSIECGQCKKHILNASFIDPKPINSATYDVIVDIVIKAISVWEWDIWKKIGAKWKISNPLPIAARFWSLQTIPCPMSIHSAIIGHVSDPLSIFIYP